MDKKITGINNNKLTFEAASQRKRQVEGESPEPQQMEEGSNNPAINPEYYRSQVAGIQFKFNRIQYFPEDVEKMADMTEEEKSAFMRKLKLEGRYVVLPPDSNE